MTWTGEITAGATLEDRVLLCCARLALDPVTRARLDALVAGDLRWARVLAGAEAHGLTPLVARHCEGLGADRVPAEVRATLRARALVVAARNLQMARELVEVVEILAAAGVPSLPFKGPLVAADVYGGLALRSFGDLDVVVPRRALITARRALVAHGYASMYGLSERQELALLHAHGHLMLARAGASAPIELHWRFAPDCFPSIDPTDALARARQVRLSGRDVPSLGWEDLLLTLCIHGGKHVWFSLEWVCGVAELLRRGEVDLDVAFARAAVLRCGRLLRLGLRVAHAVLQAPLPPAVMRAVSDDATTRLLGEVQASLFGGRGAGMRPDEPLPHLGYQLRVQETVAGRLRYVHHVTMLPTPAEWARVQLPDWLVPLYRVARPIRLAGKHVMKAYSAR